MLKAEADRPAIAMNLLSGCGASVSYRGGMACPPVRSSSGMGESRPVPAVKGMKARTAIAIPNSTRGRDGSIMV